LDKLYLRHARLYLGDCLFSLQRYEEDLKHFERAAWIYKDIPSSLSAYVQIINCHVFLGQVDEARAALRRVQYLVKAIPDDAFGQALAPNSRDEWGEYFNWLDESGLF
jgi:tetratricopeptide (TPR) repeat protein